MWSEICELMPLTTGLDSCIEHDIAELENCAEANERKGYIEAAESYRRHASELKQRKAVLDSMNPIARWWHCERQFRKDQKERQKVINEYKKRTGIWW